MTVEESNNALSKSRFGITEHRDREVVNLNVMTARQTAIMLYPSSSATSDEVEVKEIQHHHPRHEAKASQQANVPSCRMQVVYRENESAGYCWIGSLRS